MTGTTLLGLAAVVSTGTLLLGPVSVFAPHDPQPHTIQPGELADGQIVNTISLRLDEEGVLHAQERITFGGEGPAEFTRTFQLKEPYDTDHNRLYEFTGLDAHNGTGDPGRGHCHRRRHHHGRGPRHQG